MGKLGLGGLLVAVLVAALAVTGCGGGSGSSDDGGSTVSSTAPVTLTFWSWDPSTANAAKLYEKSHPNVTVKVVNAGITTDEYTKFRAAVRAGDSDPDVVMLDFTETETFKAEGLIRNLSEYGADKVRDDFAPWYMKLLSQDEEGLYGLPLDAGLVAFLYRDDILAEHGLKPPATWAEFKTTAERLHQEDPSTYLSDFPISFDWLTPLLYQRGWRPFEVDGEDIKIDVNSKPAREVAAYWDELIASGAVKPGAEFSTSWFSGIDRGTFAGIVAAAWVPTLIEETSDTFGKWRAAPIPQWNAGEDVTPQYGGSVYAVSSKSDDPAQAADLVKYVTSNQQVVDSNNAKEPYTFYPLRKLYESHSWLDEKLPFYGTQRANRVFGTAAEHVIDDIQFPPFQTQFLEEGNKLFGEAINNGGSLVEAIEKLQSATVEYAEQQGFTVSE